MFFYKNISDEEILNQRPKNIKKYTLNTMTDLEKTFLINAFHTDFSPWEFSKSFNDIIGFNIENRTDVDIDCFAEKIKQLNHSFKDSIIISELESTDFLAILLNHINKFIKNEFENLKNLNDIDAIIQTVFNSFFNKYPNDRFFSEKLSTKKLNDFLLSINRSDLTAFIDLFRSSDFSLRLDEIFNWNLQQRAYFLNKHNLENNFKDKINHLKSSFLFEEEDLLVFQQHVSAIEFYLREQNEIEKGEDPYYDDDDWWEFMGEPRSIALDYFEDLINKQFNAILSLWCDSQKEYLNGIKKIVSHFILEKFFAQDMYSPFLKELIQKKLFSNEKKLSITLLLFENHIEPDYYVHLD